MTNVDEGKPNGAENEKNKSELEDSTTVDVGVLDESKAQLINGGAGDDHPEKFKTAIVDPGAASSDGEVTFNGLGKDEVLQYANDPFWVRLRWIMFILFWVGWVVMLVTAIAIIVLAPRCPDRPDLKWYHTDNVYEVVPKSFKDSDGDGLGDFQGLKDKEEYITDDLDTNAIWLTAMYLSDSQQTPGIVDHKALDPTFVDDFGKFKSWVKKLRKKGTKVIMDLVPNHTSKNHTWFQNSRKGKDEYKDYYVWADGSSTTVPNDWKTADGSESAWTYDTIRGAWYLHQFSKDLPDLNLHNQAVVDEIIAIMEFWFDAGVSGFNIRDLEYLVENKDFSAKDDVDRSQTRNYNGTLAVLEQLRKVADDFSDKPGKERVLFGTVQNANRTQIENYWGKKDSERLHIVTPLMKDLAVGSDADSLKRMIEEFISEDTDEEQWLGLQLGNQGTSRIASRLANGDGFTYRKRLLTTHALQLLMPGTSFVYYGDEFGQRDGMGREPELYMAPMQWDNTANAGFTKEGVYPWTEISLDYEIDNVEAGQLHFKDIKTPYEVYTGLTELRKRESFQFGKTKMCTVRKDLFMFSRAAHRFPFFAVFLNMGPNDMTVTPTDLKCLPTKDEAVVAFHSQDKKTGETIDLEDAGLHLEPYDVVVLEFAADD